MEQLKQAAQTQLSNTSGYTFLFISLFLLSHTQAAVSKGSSVPQHPVAMLSSGDSEARGSVCAVWDAQVSTGAGMGGSSSADSELPGCHREQECPDVDTGTEGQNLPAPEHPALQTSSFWGANTSLHCTLNVPKRQTWIYLSLHNWVTAILTQQHHSLTETNKGMKSCESIKLFPWRLWEKKTRRMLPFLFLL